MNSPIMIDYRSVSLLWILCTAGFPVDYLRDHGRKKCKYMIPFHQIKRVLPHDMFGYMRDLNQSVKTYRHSIARIFPIHELYFHCNVTGRALTICEVQALWVHVQEVPTNAGRQSKESYSYIKCLILTVPIQSFESNFILTYLEVLQAGFVNLIFKGFKKLHV